MRIDLKDLACDIAIAALIVFLAVSMCGCWSVWPFVGKNEPKFEANNEKKEENSSETVNITNHFGDGTTATEGGAAVAEMLFELQQKRKIEAQGRADAERKLADAKAESDRIRAEADKATAELREEKAWADKWKDRFMWAVIALVVSVIIFPAWFYKRYLSAKAEYGHIVNDMKKSMDVGMDAADLTKEQSQKMKVAMSGAQQDRTKQRLRSGT